MERSGPSLRGQWRRICQFFQLNARRRRNVNIMPQASFTVATPLTEWFDTDLSKPFHYITGRKLDINEFNMPEASMPDGYRRLSGLKPRLYFQTIAVPEFDSETSGVATWGKRGIDALGVSFRGRRGVRILLHLCHF
ncbi:hypothetical protein AVEN_242686-1 [Araneus ventricosus]|uniref:Uncharacterized protein n=1 Tax=Araneus ventricosus TaxID=182803 RepID=A0A4Y2DYR1_ARAVE|nr:hypothetical protein AVEN_242686-1 [Araneus ventricosus]